MAFDSILWLSGLAAELVLILLLIKFRAYRLLPAFFTYLCLSLLCDSSFFVMQSLWPAFFARQYFRMYEVQMVVEAAVMFAVLVELAWSVLRPIRNSLPKGSWIAIAAIVALAGLLLWPVAGLTLSTKLPLEWQNYFRLEQTFAILRVLVFMVLAGFSNLLSIGWRNRELQVATGLGFYSIVSLSITVLHSHLFIGEKYHWLDQVVALSYLSALAYWVLAFATKEAERQDFTPQMANFLLLVGGTAKAGRVAVTDFSVTKRRPRNER